MLLRNYQPGDEQAQARVFNAAAAALPKFKPASADEIARRYAATEPDPASKFYAVEGLEVVAYAVLNPNGRVGYPWCLPGAEAAQAPLFEAVLAELEARAVPEAWAAYRDDWRPVVAFFEANGFARARSMVNYLAPLDRLPRAPAPEGHSIRPLDRADLDALRALDPALFADDPLEASFWENPYFGPESLFALRRDADNTLLGAALVIGDAGYADPAKVDPNMPCFRLGTLGTGRERHKRLNGVVSCVAATEAAGVALLAEAARRLAPTGLAHVAAQAATDHPAQVALYDRFFDRQGAFPILTPPELTGIRRSIRR